MKTKLFFMAILVIILALGFISCNNGTIGNFAEEPVFVAANTTKGFNYGYYYYIPASLRKSSKHFLFVQPNNSGMFVQDHNFTIDDAHIHEAAAQNMMDRKRLWADELGAVLLVPAIPRPRGFPPNVEPQVLDRGALQISTGTHARVDLQLIMMINDLRVICQSIGINLESKILIDGFSAGGTFGNRFTAIHPELVQAIVSGGVTSTPILPFETLDGERLMYPVGIADIGTITGKPFNLQAYRTIPQFIYFGSEDTNSGPPIFEEEILRIRTKVLGSDTQRRWERVQEIFRQQGFTSVTFKTYQMGHTYTRQMEQEFIRFLKTHMR